MKILAVVRYRTPLSDSQTFQGFSKVFALRPELAEAYENLIWDNSPEPLRSAEFPTPFVYQQFALQLRSFWGMQLRYAVLPPHGTEKEAHRIVAAEGKRTARI